jgi:hypothetical protein
MCPSCLGRRPSTAVVPTRKPPGDSRTSSCVSAGGRGSPNSKEGSSATAPHLSSFQVRAQPSLCDLAKSRRSDDKPVTGAITAAAEAVSRGAGPATTAAATAAADHPTLPTLLPSLALPLTVGLGKKTQASCSWPSCCTSRCGSRTAGPRASYMKR